MPHLIWTDGALRDVRRLQCFVASKNPDAAARAVRAIRASTRTIAEHPEAGRPAAGRGPEDREWIIPFGGAGYVMLYRFEGETVAILAVRHQSEAGYS